MEITSIKELTELIKSYEKSKDYESAADMALSGASAVFVDKVSGTDLSKRASQLYDKAITEYEKNKQYFEAARVSQKAGLFDRAEANYEKAGIAQYKTRVL